MTNAYSHNRAVLKDVIETANDRRYLRYRYEPVCMGRKGSLQVWFPELFNSLYIGDKFWLVVGIHYVNSFTSIIEASV